MKNALIVAALAVFVVMLTLSLSLALGAPPVDDMDWTPPVAAELYAEHSREAERRGFTLQGWCPACAAFEAGAAQ